MKINKERKRQCLNPSLTARFLQELALCVIHCLVVILFIFSFKSDIQPLSRINAMGLLVT